MFIAAFDFWSSTLHQYPCIGWVLVVVQKLRALTLTTPTSPNLSSCALSLEKPGGWADDDQWANSGLLPVFLKFHWKPTTVMYYMLSVVAFLLQQWS